MTRANLIDKLIAYASDDYDSADVNQVTFVEGCIDNAIEEVCREMYPWGVVTDKQRNALIQKAIVRYPYVILRVAQFHYDKQGKEGVTTFYESGQTTSFDGGGTPQDFFRSIVPIGKVR